jgi:hypothetical protein
MKIAIPLALLLALGIVAACSDEEDTTGGTATGTGAITSSTSSETTATGCGSYQYSVLTSCQGCLEAHCCTELGACDVGSECASLVDCLKSCAAEDCVADCSTSHAAGLEGMQALYACLDGACTADCEPPEDGMCGTELSYPDSDSLTACVTESCCDSYLPCYGEADCNECIRDPEAAGCDANELFDDYLACKAESCPSLLCGSALGYPSWVLNLCINDTCCSSYTPCFDDADCRACLQSPTAAGCAANTLFTSFVTCREGSCPTLVCTTTVGFMAPGGEDPAFECNLCAGEHCCEDLDACDGNGTTAETNLCVVCLNDPDAAACSDSVVHDAAVAFNSCLAADCPLECPTFNW